MAISIDFLSNVSGFLRGTRDVEGALDDVAGTLDDLVPGARRAGDSSGRELASGLTSGGADAERALGDVQGAIDDLSGKTEAGDQLGAEVKGGGSDAEQAVDSLEAKFRDLASASRSESTKVGSDLSHSVKKGTEEADEGVRTLKENTGSNLKEVAASFDGTWQGVAGGAQGLVAEIAEGFGPAGLIAGAVAAGGLGLIITAIEGGEQKTEEFKGKVAELATQFIETKGDAKRSLQGIEDAITDLATTQDGLNLAEIYKLAKDAGADYRDIVLAIGSGSPKEIARVIGEVQNLKDQHDIAATAASYHGDKEYAANLQAAKSARDLGSKLTDLKGIADDAAKAQELAAKAGLTDFALKRKAVEQVHDAYADAAGEVDDYVDKESGLFDVSKYIKAMNKRADALRDYQETLQKSSLSPEARDYIESQGEEQAATLMAGYKRATPDQRDELNQIWTTSGRQSASSYAEALGDDLAGRRIKPPRLLGPDTSAYKAAVQEAREEAQEYLRKHPLQAGAVAYTGYGKPLY